MSKKKVDIGASIVLIIISIVFWTQTLKFEPMAFNDIGSAIFPQVVLAGLMIMCILKIVLALRNKDEGYNATPEKGDIDYARFLGTFALLFAYVFSFRSLGFLLSSVIYLFLQLLLFSNKTRRTTKWIVIYAALSILLPLSIHILFVKILRLMLPAGVLTKILL